MLLTLWGTLRRTWAVALVGIIVTAGAVAWVASRVPVTYLASGQVALLPPRAQESANPQAENPYLNLAGLQSMCDLVSRAMSDERTAQSLRRSGIDDYTVRYDTLTPAPIILIEAQQSTPGGAMEALDVLTTEVSRTLASLQAASSVSASYYITATAVSRPEEPTRSGKGRLRAIIVVLMAGGMLTLLSTVLTDASRSRRTQRSAQVDDLTAATDSPSVATTVEASRVPDPVEPGVAPTEIRAASILPASALPTKWSAKGTRGTPSHGAPSMSRSQSDGTGYTSSAAPPRRDPTPSAELTPPPTRPLDLFRMRYSLPTPTSSAGGETDAWARTDQASGSSGPSHREDRDSNSDRLDMASDPESDSHASGSPAAASASDDVTQESATATAAPDVVDADEPDDSETTRRVVQRQQAITESNTEALADRSSANVEQTRAERTGRTDDDTAEQRAG